ncbi:membrane protein [Streptomyces sp. PRh5]|uniref:MAB_1171c family putative transporter n=1 Tax=Streptomyces sp. PRh5 TaxID=1158056 RepID=UPI0004510D7F|nr:MAB_1171c family putative transporter [Streptomyces sp. PRh5]EXU64813.1 membrane protein [Streptomyces sp. PRh5]
MQQLLHPIPLTLAVVGFLLLLWPPRHLCQDRALAALVGLYGFCALSFLVSVAPVWTQLGDTTGHPAIGILGAFGTVVAQVSLQPIVVVYWVLPREKARKVARLCLGAGAVVILALTVLFLQLPNFGQTTPQGITAMYIHSGVYRTYLVLYVIAYTVGQTVLAVGCWTAARRTDQAWIARGLRTVGTGAVLTFGFSAVRLAGVGATLFGLSHPAPAAESFAWICADGGNSLVLIGFFIPTLALRVVPHVRVWARAHRDYRSLAPLWEAVHHAVPAIALRSAPTPTAVWLHFWDPTWRLYRRAVEIRDGQWALRNHLEESVRSAAEQRRRVVGLTGAELAYAVTADQLRAVLATHSHNGFAQTSTEYADADIRQEIRTPDDDVRALLRIAAHFNTSPAEQEVTTSWT